MEASAGTAEKMDALVTVYDSYNGIPSETIELEIYSPVKSLFGSAQQAAVLKALEELGVQRCRVEVQDSQAVDSVLSARVKSAVIRLRKAGGAL